MKKKMEGKKEFVNTVTRKTGVPLNRDNKHKRRNNSKE